MKANNYICIDEITKRYGLSGTCIYHWIAKYGMPKPIKFGHLSVWCEADLKEWFGKRALAGEPLPRPRRKYGPRKPKPAAVEAPPAPVPTAAKPRIYKRGDLWCIDGPRCMVYKGKTPQKAYEVYQKWTEPCGSA